MRMGNRGQVRVRQRQVLVTISSKFPETVKCFFSSFILSFFFFTRVDVSGLVCMPGYGYHDLSQRHLSNVLF